MENHKICYLKFTRAVTQVHTSTPIFFGGSSDENEKVLGKFLARLRRAKKGVPKFFVVEALKTAKKPLKTNR